MYFFEYMVTMSYHRYFIFISFFINNSCMNRRENLLILHEIGNSTVCEYPLHNETKNIYSFKSSTKKNTLLFLFFGKAPLYFHLFFFLEIVTAIKWRTISKYAEMSDYLLP